MIKYNGTGYINQTGYGVMKLGDEPTLKPQFSLLTDEHFKNIDAQRKYGNAGKKGIKQSHRYWGTVLSDVKNF